jgi:hypothetical protein
MTAAIIILGALCAILPALAIFGSLKLDAAHKENSAVLLEQLATSRRNEAKSQQAVIDIQAEIVKNQQETINALHTRMTMEEAQASADLNEQYGDFQTRNAMAMQGGMPQEPLTHGPNGHIPSGWSDPISPTTAALEDIPEEYVPIPREDEPTDL